MPTTSFSLRAHERPLSRISDNEIDQYLIELEDILDERMTAVDSAEHPVFPEIERSTYEQLLEGIGQVESIEDLYHLSKDVISTESVFPSPFKHLGIVSNSKEFLKASYLEEAYEEAVKSYQTHEAVV